MACFKNCILFKKKQTNRSLNTVGWISNILTQGWITRIPLQRNAELLPFHDLVDLQLFKYWATTSSVSILFTWYLVCLIKSEFILQIAWSTAGVTPAGTICVCVCGVNPCLSVYVCMCVFVCVSASWLCVHSSTGIAETDGERVGLFLGQWQCVNGCRCVGKESS